MDTTKDIPSAPPDSLESKHPPLRCTSTMSTIRTPYEHFLVEARDFTESPAQATKIWKELIHRCEVNPTCVYDVDEGRILTIVATKFLRDIRRVAKEYISNLTRDTRRPITEAIPTSTELPSEYFSIHPVRPHFKVKRSPVVSFLDGMTHIENDRHFIILPSTQKQEVFLDAHGDAWVVLLKGSHYNTPGIPESGADDKLPVATTENITQLLQPTPLTGILSTIASASYSLKFEEYPNRFLSLLPGETLLIKPSLYVSHTLKKFAPKRAFTTYDSFYATACVFREQVVSEFEKQGMIVWEEITEETPERFADGIMKISALCETRGIYWHVEKQLPFAPTYASLDLERNPGEPRFPLAPSFSEPLAPVVREPVPLFTPAPVPAPASPIPTSVVSPFVPPYATYLPPFEVDPELL